MTADGRCEQNLFYLLEAPGMLYIRLTIKLTDSVRMKHIKKNLATIIILVWYEFPDGTIVASK